MSIDRLEAWEKGEWTPEETRRLSRWRSRLEAIARDTGDDFRLKVAMGKPGTRLWLYHSLTKTAFFDPVEVLEREATNEEAVSLGSIAHEGAHHRITDWSFMPEEEGNKVGFVSIVRAVEERPTDNDVRTRRSGAGKWVDRMRTVLFQESETLKEVEQQHGQAPRFVQLCNLIVFARQEGGSSDLVTPEIRELYEHIRPFVEEVENTLPPEKANAAQRLEFSKKRHAIVREKIFPAVEHLIEQDKEEKNLQQMVKEKLQEILDKLSDGLKTEMTQFMGHPGAVEHPPIGQMSFELFEELKKQFDALLEEEKEKICAEAQKLFEEIDDILAKEYGGIMEPYSIPTHTQIAEGEAKEKRLKELAQEREAEKSQAAEEMERVRERLEAAKEKDHYEQLYQEVREEEDALYRRLEEIFSPNIARRTRLDTSGLTLSLPAVYRWESAKGGGAMISEEDMKIWETTDRPDRRSYHFSIVIDLSGSMNTGNKLHEQAKTVVLLTEVLNRLGISFEVIGFSPKFTGSYSVLKKASEDVSDQMRQRLALVDTASWLGISTPLLEGVLAASDTIRSLAHDRSFLLVLTDGIPDRQKLTKQTIQDLHNSMNIVGVGIGKGTERVANFFPTALPNVEAKDLTHTLGDLLQDMIVNPGKYRV